MQNSNVVRFPRPVTKPAERAVEAVILPFPVKRAIPQDRGLPGSNPLKTSDVKHANPTFQGNAQ